MSRISPVEFRRPFFSKSPHHPRDLVPTSDRKNCLSFRPSLLQLPTYVLVTPQDLRDPHVGSLLGPNPVGRIQDPTLTSVLDFRTSPLTRVNSWWRSLRPEVETSRGAPRNEIRGTVREERRRSNLWVTRPGSRLRPRLRQERGVGRRREGRVDALVPLSDHVTPLDIGPVGLLRPHAGAPPSPARLRLVGPSRGLRAKGEVLSPLCHSLGDGGGEG